MYVKILQIVSCIQLDWKIVQESDILSLKDDLARFKNHLGEKWDKIGDNEILYKSLLRIELDWFVTLSSVRLRLHSQQTPEMDEPRLSDVMTQVQYGSMEHTYYLMQIK